MNSLFGGIDAGGTNWVCAVGLSPTHVQEVAVLPTSSNPEDTLDRVTDFFRPWYLKGVLSSIGLSCFGPIERNPQSPHWGSLGNTPKSGWKNFDLGAAFNRRLVGLPIGIETDVAGSALAEAKWGGGSGLRDICYITAGTGIGGALIANGELVSGVAHSEIGHSFGKRHPKHSYPGCCVAHGDCFEGLASGQAIFGYTGKPAANLPDNHQAWDFTSFYLGQLCANIFMFSSSERIILGGGLLKRASLIDKIRKSAADHIGGYVSWPREHDLTSAVSVSPWVKNERADKANSGVFGGFLIAKNAYRDSL